MEIAEGYIVNRFGKTIKEDKWFWNDPVAEESIDSKVDINELTSEEQASVTSPAGYTMHRVMDKASAAYPMFKDTLGAKNNVDKTVATIREYATK